MSASLRSNIGIAKHVITENIKQTEEIIGKGAYGEVVKMIMGGRTVAGKRIHSSLLEDGQEGREKMISRFEEECMRYRKARMHVHVHLARGALRTVAT